MRKSAQCDCRNRNATSRFVTAANYLIDLHCCKHYFMPNLISLVLLPLFMVLVYSISPPVMLFGNREILNTITSVFSVITRKCTKGSSCRLPKAITTHLQTILCFISALNHLFTLWLHCVHQ